MPCLKKKLGKSVVTGFVLCRCSRSNISRYLLFILVLLWGIMRWIMIPRLVGGAYINRRQFLITVRSILHTIQSLYLFITMSKNPKSETQHPQQPSAPPPFDPTQPSVPISYPIKTLQELESRSYFESFHYPFNRASVPPILNNGVSPSLPNRRRMLVCHDMAGGYLDDKWIQGGTNPDAYAIWHWHLIDVFVYFSHSLVTLPPPCWTNTAHRHGVKVPFACLCTI